MVFPFDDYDITATNSSDGQTFYGYNDPDTGTTDWYDKYGNLDSVTKTPPVDEDDW